MRMTRARYVRLSRIRALDPERDHVEIYLAFSRSFSVPAIAAVHVATGEPGPRPPCAGSTRSTVPTPSANDEYLYVLGCLVVLPLRFLQRYGWRPPCCHERRASLLFYRDLGRRMGIHDIP
jgi:hypothetical protein